MTTHDAFLELAAAGVDFTLTSAERGRLDQHLAGCPACARSAAGFHADVLALESLPPVVLPERRGAEILAEVLHPHAVSHPLRLLAVAALLGLLLIGTLIAGTELLRNDDNDLVVVPPLPSASPAIDASPTVAPSVDPLTAGGILALTRGETSASWAGILDLDTGTLSGLGVGADPAWGPDGLLVYACGKALGDNTTICTVDVADPGTPQPEIASGSTHPVPAPDGSLIAIHRGTIDVGETWLVRPDGSDLHRLAAGSFLQWSPDGAWLLGQPDSATFEVAVVGIDGTAPRVLATGYDPAWSPSGQRIVYAVVVGDAAMLREADAEAGTSEDLYTAPAGSTLSTPAYLGPGAWVFVQDGDLWRLETGTGQNVLTRLTTGLDIRAEWSRDALDVSPDGRRVAFSTGSGSDARVGIAAADGSGWQVLTLGEGPVTQPKWAPDGTVLGPTDAPSPAAVEPLGTTWSAATTPVSVDRPVGRMEAVTADAPGYVAVGRGCMDGDPPVCEAVVWTSADGSAWERVPASDATNTGSVVTTSGPEVGMFDVAHGAGGLVAIGYAARPDMEATAWHSLDGVTWQRIPLGSADRVRVGAVTWTGRGYVIVGEERPVFRDVQDIATAQARAAAWTSTDGIAWTQVPYSDALDAGGFIDTMEDPASGGMSDVVAGQDGIVAVGSVCTSKPAGCEPAAWFSPDGTTWERASSVPPLSGRFASVAASSAGYVAVGTDACDSPESGCPGLVMTSDDGRTWVRQPFEQTGDFQTVTRVGSRFLGTLQSGPEPVWASDDGTAWAPAAMQGGPAMDAISDTRFAAGPDTAVWIGITAEANEPAAWVSRATQP